MDAIKPEVMIKEKAGDTSSPRIDVTNLLASDSNINPAFRMGMIFGITGRVGQ